MQHDVDGRICVDRAQFTLVLKNIIENGIKYNKSAEPIIEIWKESDAEYDHVSIKDNGIGLGDKYRDEIFEMFKRLHNKKEYEGSGLGLSICHKIIQEHQGSIRVESELGHGSTLIISISRKQCEDNQK